MGRLRKDEVGDVEALHLHEYVHGPEMVSAAVLAEWLGLTPNRVSTLARDGILPRGDDNLFPLRASVRAYADHARAGALGRRADVDLTAQKLRLATENADKLALQNAKARGDLASLTDVERAWAGILRDVRAALLALPSRAAARLGHLSAHDVKTLDSEVRAVLEELSNE